MKKILLVEDNKEIHDLIKNALEKERYIVKNAYSGTEALIILEKENVDIILLDLMLPGLNGEEIIKKIKSIPIIVISAKVSNEDKINSLLIGANDYITKPFDMDELLARVKVQLRINNTSKNNDLKYKEMTLNCMNHTLILNDQKISLTKTEYNILQELLLEPNRVVTKSRLIELMSNDTLNFDENSLKVHISNIRKKIKQVTDKEYIESVWGIGFKMVD